MVKDKAIEETEMREKAESQKRCFEKNAVIDGLRAQLRQTETEQANERENHKKELAEALAKHEEWTQDMQHSAHEILAARLREAEHTATNRLTIEECRVESLQEELEREKRRHQELTAALTREAMEKEQQWLEAFSKVKHLRCVQESFQDVDILKKKLRRTTSESRIGSPQSPALLCNNRTNTNLLSPTKTVKVLF